VEEHAGHSLSLVDRKNLAIDGVRHVGGFNESEISLETGMGPLLLLGEGMHITKLNMETGELCVEGFLTAIQYLEKKVRDSRKKGILKRILK